MSLDRDGAAPRQHFASDNYAGMCPEARHWLHGVRRLGHQPAYGEDVWTQRVSDTPARAVPDRLRRLLRLQRHGRQFAGAGLDVPELPQRHLHAEAHIETDECGGAGVLLQRLQAADVAAGARSAS